MKKLSLTLITLLAGAAAFLAGMQVHASDLSYTFAELRYVDNEIDFDDGEADADGFSLAGSYRLPDELSDWFVAGGYSDVDFDGFSADATELKIGGGYIHPFNEDVDLIGSLSLLRVEIDGAGGDDSETGFLISGGARTMIVDSVEVRGTLNIGNVETAEFFGEVAGDYYFTDQFVAGLALQLGDRAGFSIGGRFYFR